MLNLTSRVTAGWRRQIAGLSVAALVLGYNSLGWSAGFALNEMGARPLGMGNAFTAIADNPTAIFFNPAGLVSLSGIQVEGGVSMVAPSFGYTTTIPGSSAATDVSGEDEIFWVPNFYATYRVHDRAALGIGVYAPFGLGLSWPESVDVNGTSLPWPGRTSVRHIELQTMFITPTAAIKLHDRIYIGGGLSIVKGAVTLERNIAAPGGDPADDVLLKLSGDDVSFGATAGLLIKAVPRLLNVGFTYRGGTTLSFGGSGVFRDRNGGRSGISASLQQRLRDGRVRADLTLPHTFSFGIAAFPTERLTVGVTLDVVTWSSHEEMRIQFLDDPELTTAEPKNWRNTVAVRLGAEYEVVKNLPVRLGFIFDQSPVPNTTVGPELPDADRYEVTVGIGYSWMGFRADLAYLMMFTGDNDTAPTAPITGQYRSSSHVVGLSLAWTCGC